jgi:hypothetical protein
MYFSIFFFLQLLTSEFSALFWPPEPAPQPRDPESPEDTRKRDLIYSDQVHRINLVPYITEHLGIAVAAAGGEGPFQEEWLSRVDKGIVKAFQNVGIM